MKRKYKLLKELPQCPIGTILQVQNEEYAWVHAAGTGFQIPIKVLEDYPEWFKEIIELPGSINDIKINCGWVIHNDTIAFVENDQESVTCKNTMFATKAQAKSALAFAQLSQLAKVMNDGWKFDWNNIEELKYFITNIKGKLEVSYVGTRVKHLVFKTRELAEFSLKHHRELWKDYWMISK